MTQTNNVLNFSGKPQEIAVEIDRLKTQLELAHRRGCFGLMGLFSKNLPKETLLKLETAKQMVGQLAGDLMTNAMIRGKLDMSGFHMPEKKRRVAKSRAGNTKTYYRDYWFTCRLRTVDTAQLRVTIGEDVKEKKGTATRKSRVAVKVVPNLRVYTVVQPSADTVRRAFPLNINEMMAKPEGITLNAGAGSRELKASEVLRVVKVAYNCLVLNRIAEGAQRSPVV